MRFKRDIIMSFRFVVELINKNRVIPVALRTIHRPEFGGSKIENEINDIMKKKLHTFDPLELCQIRRIQNPYNWFVSIEYIQDAYFHNSFYNIIHSKNTAKLVMDFEKMAGQKGIDLEEEKRSYNTKQMLIIRSNITE